MNNSNNYVEKIFYKPSWYAIRLGILSISFKGPRRGCSYGNLHRLRESRCTKGIQKNSEKVQRIIILKIRYKPKLSRKKMLEECDVYIYDLETAT